MSFAAKHLSQVIDRRQAYIQRIAVTVKQMQAIEQRLFDAGMPVAALMEKVAGLLAQRVCALFPPGRVGVLVGSGHNGGDALVVARELHWRGYEVAICCPFAKLKPLTEQHGAYVKSLGIPWVEVAAALGDCDFFIDGLFGFGLERPLEGAIAAAVTWMNQQNRPILSIDLPSGIHSDTGEVMGTALKATRTFCLGLWKRAFLQDAALDWLGEVELVDFDIPLADIHAVLGEVPKLQRITPTAAIAALPLPRPQDTHKYKVGHLLLVCGSRRYTGATILAGLGARASGVGMLSILVPESLKLWLSAHLPEALILGCPETETGAMQVPEDLVASLTMGKYDAIACGCGVTPEAKPLIEALLASDFPLLLDADGLNILAQSQTTPIQRQPTTVLTPHPGEFKRLFPEIAAQTRDRLVAAQTAAEQSGAIVVLKGARTAIASPDSLVWVNPSSTPALARGGSGDVLAGLLGGLMAQQLAPGDMAGRAIAPVIAAGVWWHAQAGILAAKMGTELGVDAFTLAQSLSRGLAANLSVLTD